MTTTQRPTAEPSRYSPPKGRSSTVQTPRGAIYIAILLATILSAAGYKLRHQGLFACDASGYGANRYTAYCQAKAYGDYDYGAFWYNLEPEATAAASNADVLFLGDSRLQFGLSSDATARWFDAHSEHFYLLGFAYIGNMAFGGPLLNRLHPRAKVYVINVDRYFSDVPTEPAQVVMNDSAARPRYGEKRFWQGVHHGLCSRVVAICGHEAAFFRDRSNGRWVQTGGNWTSSPVAYSDTVDRQHLDQYVALGRAFLTRLPVSRECVVLTTVPKAGGALGLSHGTAKAIAAALGLPLVSPELGGLTTFDGSHLDQPSAERWSSAFVDAAAPSIQKCLRQPGA